VATKGKKKLPVPCITSSSCPWQQKKIRNRAGARAGQGQGRASRAVKNKE